MAPALCLAGALVLGLYVAHWRYRADPILDLRLLGNETLQNRIIGGSLFRIGAGALPFLLPLLLQVGFGYTAFQAGSITFAAAGGAILMKFAAPPFLRRFGFRTTLAVNALLCAARDDGQSAAHGGHSAHRHQHADVHRRLLPLAAVHEPERNRLRRCAGRRR